MTQAAATPAPVSPGEFQLLHLAQLVESPTNPRRHFDEEYLGELAASVKEVGVVQAITVRPHPKPTAAGAQFEIVAGACRFRAAKRAALERIPAVVRNLTDHQALQIQIIENLQRRDIHPLDEAHGYQRLLDDIGMTVKQIAEKVGKSPEFIYARLKLLEASSPVRKALEKGEISAEHAVVIARAPSKNQPDGLRLARDGYNVKEIRQWGKELDDEQKRQERVQGEISRAKAAGERVVDISEYHNHHTKRGVLGPDKYAAAGKGVCDHLARGFLVNYRGEYEGRNAKVCIAPDTCPVHKTTTDAPGRIRREPTKKAPAELARERRAKARKLGYDRALAALRVNVKSLGDEDFRFIGRAFIEELWHEHRKEICRRHGWEIKKRAGGGGQDVEGPILRELQGLNGRELQAFVLEIAFSGKHVHDPATFNACARRHGVTFETYEAVALRELTDKGKKAETPKKAAPAKAGKAARPGKRAAPGAAKRLQTSAKPKARAKVKSAPRKPKAKRAK